MKKLLLPAFAAGAASLLLAACSTDFKDSDYPMTSAKVLPSELKDASIGDVPCKGVAWTDSVSMVEAAHEYCHPWTGDPFGVYVRDQILNSTLLELYKKNSPKPADGKELSPEDALKEAKKLLSKDERENFIIRQIAFQTGKSDATVYWLEINDPGRQSRFIDKILWSKMFMTRTFFYDPPVSFSKAVASCEAAFGKTPEVKKLEDSSLWKWYKRQVDPKASYHPEKEILWHRGALTIALYDWKNPDDASGRSELTVRNEAVILEFKEKIRERVETLIKERKQKDENAATQALVR